MNLELVEITPAIADYYLSKNTANRKIIENNVSALARALLNNEWVVNGDAIRFDENGNLVDGQHRLTACVRAGVPFTSYVIRNLSPKAFLTIDSGSKRKASDALSINSIDNSVVLSSIIKCYVESKLNNGFGSPKLGASTTQILNEYNSNPELYDKLALTQFSISKFVTTPFMAICKAAIEIYGDEWFDDAISKIKTGQNLSYGDPCLTLREWSIANKGMTKRQSVRAIYVKAVRAMATGSKVKLLRYTELESFPTLN